MLVLLAIAGLFLLPSPWGVLALGAALAVEVVELMFWRWFVRRYRLRVGPETLVGMRAEVVQPYGSAASYGTRARARRSNQVKPSPCREWMASPCGSSRTPETWASVDLDVIVGLSGGSNGKGPR